MTKINGVDTKVIENIVENYKKNPEEGIAGWSSSVEWIGGFYAEAQIGDHKPVLIEEPDWFSGSNKGPNPAELLLSALDGCLSISFIVTKSIRQPCCFLFNWVISRQYGYFSSSKNHFY
ncbi:hypothetical protein QRD90_14760 [Peribacillus frigoritolerans]|uniref:OsmC family protein n=1 Tax=Peribacillus frigoritolerans TaxID=450367 RepID=UPI002079C544|nr:hypothetical protein [Peribacillus frigoritolerans]USK78192.1 hypothetical protein LHV56_14955 [Peribacillus frigoritolerans]WJE45520.1 hypothetical protein QRD90_14760 [Peribacillus frigoritolerans]